MLSSHCISLEFIPWPNFGIICIDTALYLCSLNAGFAQLLQLASACDLFPHKPVPAQVSEWGVLYSTCSFHWIALSSFFLVGTIDVGKTRLMFWDLGGQEELQSLWDKVGDVVLFDLIYTACPEELWLLCPWKCSEPGWMELSSAWSSGRCLYSWQEVGMGCLALSNTNHPVIPWFLLDLNHCNHLVITQAYW